MHLFLIQKINTNEIKKLVDGGQLTGVQLSGGLLSGGYCPGSNCPESYCPICSTPHSVGF
jgi:hypothetical protein